MTPVKIGHKPKPDHPWYKAFGGPRTRAERRIQRLDPHLHIGSFQTFNHIMYVWDDRLPEDQQVLMSADLKDLVAAVQAGERPKPPKVKRESKKKEPPADGRDPGPFYKNAQ